MRNWITLYREALDRYMPSICASKMIALSVFVFVFIGAQTRVGALSSGGVSPLVAATAVYLAFMIYGNLTRVKCIVLSLDKIARDAILGTVAVFAGCSVAALLITNSDLLAMRYFTLASIGYGIVYLYGAFNRDLLSEYIAWPWRGLSMGVTRAGAIMSAMYFISAGVSEYFIANTSVGAWALMRVIWPVFALKIGHALIVADQVRLRHGRSRGAAA